MTDAHTCVIEMTTYRRRKNKMEDLNLAWKLSKVTVRWCFCML